ncbi:putative deoxyribodipyrimidine photolyase putative DNA repair enzyme [Leptomonas seymouri]|uniref:Putative deoxyribodipyrimidine photolyase putative DNA repair enzyme n=1 Tax=Leptomonas seymouri TaxID=5684 RepID=A0A0N1PDT2_LEPSE|nr:putative deoxyribodipyrimidine photolyase putative DNA repair enzyme [Leptomonas seymouri]|eukprot:KPI87808.1 putative deoxyribodipyrimidine photolyase putative DNA repair enzyme [Leptomonas seymouri]
MAGLKRGRSRSPSTGSTRGEKKSHTELEEVALFIFRRDLRLADNTGLQALVDEAAKRSVNILPAFFFNPIQCDRMENKYFGENFFQFFCQSLEDLDGASQLNNHLVCLRGSDKECLQQIRKCGYEVAVLGYNEDFTPFARARDQLLSTYANDHGIACVVGKQDYSLRPLSEVVSGAEKPYSVFTPFFNKFLSDHASKVEKPMETNVKSIQLMLVSQPKESFEKYLVAPSQLYTHNPNIAEKGGRAEGLKRLEKIKLLGDYGSVRDEIARDQTSHLSPYMKCGAVSVREVWHTSVQYLGGTHPFTRQVVWREFYAMLLHHHPRLARGQLNAFIGQKEIVKAKRPQQNSPFQEKYENFKWSWMPQHFEAFREGRTGVPLVDAAVRCVTATGWCHNRCRMIISDFAVKVLSIDWRECERWFATVAVDYDVANNNGGWLWSSGQGADPQPFFRTFNSFRQAERFDPECAYIYKWVPELKGVPPKVVHAWDEYCSTLERQQKSGKSKGSARGEAKVYNTSYPAPIVDIKAARVAIIDKFRSHNSARQLDVL